MARRPSRMAIRRARDRLSSRLVPKRTLVLATEKVRELDPKEDIRKGYLVKYGDRVVAFVTIRKVPYRTIGSYNVKGRPFVVKEVNYEVWSASGGYIGPTTTLHQAERLAWRKWRQRKL